MSTTGENEARAQEKTITDFGEQWTSYTDFQGYYGSLSLLRDILEPLLKVEELEGCTVAEVGSGAGRIASMLLRSGVRHLTAVEPSQAYVVLRENLGSFGAKANVLRARGDQLPPSGDMEYVFSIGVIHHIPDPDPTVQAICRALKPGGRFFVWLYGREGNGLYLALAHMLRKATTRMPHSVLVFTCWVLYFILRCYMILAKVFPLPLRSYLKNMLGKYSPRAMRLNIYDQLNPAYAKYYMREEVIALLERNGFVDIQLHHRHEYSWSAICTRPEL